MLSSCVIILVGNRSYRSLPQALKILTIYFNIDLLFSLIEFTLGKLHTPNLFLMNIQIPIEYAFFTIALSYWITNERIRTILFYSIPIFTLLCITLFLTIEDFFAFSNISRPILTTLLLFCSVYVLITILKDTSTTVTSQSRFWISSGVLIYNGGNATFFLMMHYLGLVSHDAVMIAWVFHNIIGASAYILFMVGFLCQQTISKS